MKLYESGENYLEAIYMLQKQQENVRATDICNFFNFSRPSVSATIKKFKENGYVNVDENNFITLTDIGLKIAENIFERHSILAKVFMLIGVDENTAFEDACRAEHCLSEQTFECIKTYYDRHEKTKNF